FIWRKMTYTRWSMKWGKYINREQKNSVRNFLKRSIMSKIDMSLYRSGQVKRQRDGLVKSGTIAFVEWDGADEFKALHPEPAVGRSIIVNPQFGLSYTWMTSIIKEVSEDGLTKTTNNSVYTIEYGEDI